MVQEIKEMARVGKEDKVQKIEPATPQLSHNLKACNGSSLSSAGLGMCQRAPIGTEVAVLVLINTIITGTVVATAAYYIASIRFQSLQPAA